MREVTKLYVAGGIILVIAIIELGLWKHTGESIAAVASCLHAAGAVLFLGTALSKVI